jgi:8-amino-3,8-dideoxy-alpha-D-manno-octulosonate transaminase
MWTACEEAFGPDALETTRDRDGDCGISLAVFADTPDAAVGLAKRLHAEGVACGTRFSKQFPDRHVFYHWDYIMEKRSPHRNGFPWTSADRPCRIEYHREQCPNTVHWLERAVVFPITQSMSDVYVGEVCSAILKVGRAGR